MARMYQTLTDERLLRDDCSRNHFTIEVDGVETSQPVDIDVSYDINDPENKAEAQAIAEKIL